jgi:hypothetical protein
MVKIGRNIELIPAVNLRVFIDFDASHCLTEHRTRVLTTYQHVFHGVFHTYASCVALALSPLCVKLTKLMYMLVMKATMTSAGMNGSTHSAK